ncbi:Hypoxanthine-guanine phosphoribosyltransferase [Mesoplasma lactucae ATCC 49193]|nr:hypoxanthine phosphoribosyltransferase [Mesoplasma lactucae]ATZ19966.1 hypoxanthine-guanine phosphoribosyltransferase [Mesoplasma lactucae ATCC 49193]MCL8217083.1 Hypoxanthine-guanine phosphoribosyltransferase [Mesoplasma lactucae ATCC 49193]
MKKHPLVKEILFTNEQIEEATKKVATQVSDYYKAQNDIWENTVLILGLLKGCVPFYASFLKHFDYECETDFMVVSSYRGTTKTSGDPKIVLDVNTTVKGKDILIVEDVIDSGLTLKYIKAYLMSRGAKSVKIVTLIDKRNKNRVSGIEADWHCFTMGEEFIVGFGLDYQERLRNLPYIGIIDEEKRKNWKW